MAKNNTGNPKGGGQFGNTNAKGNENYKNLTVRGAIAISRGKKNTKACVDVVRQRTTFVSIDGGVFTPFSLVKITNMRAAKEVRVYGREFSEYQHKRTYRYHHKIRWIDCEEFDDQYPDKYGKHNSAAC
jgi:hypothetical protein